MPSPPVLAHAARMDGMSPSGRHMDRNEYYLRVIRSAGQPKVSTFPEVDENMCVEGAFLMQMN